MNHRGNTLVFTLLGLTVAAIVGLCFAPLQLRPCGHRGSLIDRGFSNWKPHDCSASPMIVDLYSFERYMEDVFPDKVSTYRRSGIGGYEFVATLAGNDWQVSVDRNPDLPGWYLLTSDGRLHFSEKGPAAANDQVLGNLPAP